MDRELQDRLSQTLKELYPQPSVTEMDYPWISHVPSRRKVGALISSAAVIISAALIMSILWSPLFGPGNSAVPRGNASNSTSDGKASTSAQPDGAPSPRAKDCFTFAKGAIAAPFLGKTLDDARAYAKQIGATLAVVEIDGRCVWRTLPGLNHEVDVALASGRVVRARYEQ